MKRFIVTSAGPDRFGLVALCQRYVDDQWLAEHVTAEQAAAMMTEQFKRAILAELQLLDVRCEEAAAQASQGTHRKGL